MVQISEAEFSDQVTALVMKCESALHEGRTIVIEESDIRHLTPHEVKQVHEACRRLKFLYSAATPRQQTPANGNTTVFDPRENSNKQHESKVDVAVLYGMLGSSIGRFEIVRGLGMGGHGIVFLPGIRRWTAWSH